LAGVSALAVCCLLACLSLGLTPTSALHDNGGGLSITLLDIGAGQCCVVQPPHALPDMVDMGSSTVSDVTRSCLSPFFNLHGDRAIGKVFLSHSDFDHISALSTALPAFGVETVYTSPYFAHFASIDPPAQALLDLLERAHKSPMLLERGDHVQLGGDASVDVLWPPADCGFNCNNTGMVLRLNYMGRRVLFPADIQVDAMRELLKTPEQLKADVLVAAHHGSSEVTTRAFVAAVDPSVIVSSNGSPLTQKQKRFEQMIGRRRLYRTSNCGAITVHIFSNGSVEVETLLGGGGGK
jgi:competence protein ComEC